MVRSFLLFLGILALVGGYYLLGPLPESGLTQQQVPAPNPRAAARPNVDLKSKALDAIPVGTVIGKEPPKGWSTLVLFATPTLTPEDLRDAPKVASFYARMFKFVILANVGSRRDGDRNVYWLDRLARGFAIDLKGKETIVSGQNTLGANLGLFGRRILDENERILDNDVRQVVRTDTMLLFDAQSVMRVKNAHVKMVMRHAILVDPASGKLYTLVWLLTKDYQAAEAAIQSLPNGMREARMLSVNRDDFTIGIPGPEAFALRSIPQGVAIPYDEPLKTAATLRTFTEETARQVELVLGTAAQRAASR